MGIPVLPELSPSWRLNTLWHYSCDYVNNKTIFFQCQNSWLWEFLAVSNFDTIFFLILEENAYNGKPNRYLNKKIVYLEHATNTACQIDWDSGSAHSSNLRQKYKYIGFIEGVRTLKNVQKN